MANYYFYFSKIKGYKYNVIGQYKGKTKENTKLLRIYKFPAKVGKMVQHSIKIVPSGLGERELYYNME